MEGISNPLLFQVAGAAVKGAGSMPQIGVQQPSGEKGEAPKFRDLLEQQGKKPAEPKDSQTAQTGESRSGAEQGEQEEKLPQESPQDTVRRLAEAGLVPVENLAAPVVQDVTVALPAEQAVAAVPVVELAAEVEVQAVSALTQEEAGAAQEDGAQLLAQPEQAPVELQTQAPEAAVEPQAVEAGPVFQPEREAQPEAQTAPEGPEQTARPVERAQTPVRHEAVRTDRTEEEAPVQEEDGTEEVTATQAERAPQPVFHDVKAAPVKVGEAQEARPAQEPDVSGQIGGQLAQAMANGQSRVDIQLTPENLGTVKIQLTYDQQGGVVAVVLSAERRETTDLLNRHAPMLQEMLRRNGQEAAQVEVQHNEEGQRRDQPYDGHNGHGGQENGQDRRRQHREHSGQDFLQQLRLGLIPVEE